MSRTWDEIQSEIDAAEAAIKAARQKKASAEAEAFLKAAPAAFGILAIAGVLTWALSPKAK